MNSKKYKVAIIGTGRIGFTLGFDKKREQPASHTFAVNKNPRLELLWGCDSNSENLALWKKYNPKAKVYSSTKDLFLDKSVNPDIIVVAVNEDSHLDCSISAIKSKPSLVILEKPVALNTTEAEKIKLCAKKNNVPVLVNHERRFALDYLTVKELVKSIGDIQYVVGELDSGLRVFGKEFEKDGTYSLLHDGTHLVDIIQYLFDCELKNPVVTNVYKDEKGIVRNFAAHYKTDKIPEITVKMSGRSKFFEFRIEILGTLGKICVGNGIFEYYLREESKLYTGFYSLKRKKIKLIKKTKYFENMLKNAVDYLNKKNELISPLEDAINDLKVLEKIKENL